MNLQEMSGKIKIKPSHRGLLHRDTGTPMGQKIPVSKVDRAAHSKDHAVRRRAIFAQNFGGK